MSRLCGELRCFDGHAVTEFPCGVQSGPAGVRHHGGGVAGGGRDAVVGLRREVAAGGQLHPADAQHGQQGR